MLGWCLLWRRCPWRPEPSVGAGRMFHLKPGAPRADAGYMVRPFRVLAVLVGVVVAAVAGTAWAAGGDKPEVKATSAASVTATGATLHATIKPRDLDTTYVFEYGLTKAYGAQSAEGSAGNGHNDVSVTMNVTGLDPETTYHFR